MKPIKVWLAQDDSEDNCVYCYGRKKPIRYGTYWETPTTYMLGQNLLKQCEKPIKCVIITEDEYNILTGISKQEKDCYEPNLIRKTREWNQENY